jgi:hypothetical protein
MGVGRIRFALCTCASRNAPSGSIHRHAPNGAIRPECRAGLLHPTSSRFYCGLRGLRVLGRSVLRRLEASAVTSRMVQYAPECRAVAIAPYKWPLLLRTVLYTVDTPTFHVQPCAKSTLQLDPAEAPTISRRMKISDEAFDKISHDDRVDLDEIARRASGLEMYRFMFLLRHLEFEMRWARLWNWLLMKPTPAVSQLQFEAREQFGVVPDQRIPKSPKWSRDSLMMPILRVTDRDRLRGWIDDSLKQILSSTKLGSISDEEFQKILCEEKVNLEQLARHIPGREILDIMRRLRDIEYFLRMERRWFRAAMVLQLRTSDRQDEFVRIYGFTPDGWVVDPPGMPSMWPIDPLRLRNRIDHFKQEQP